MDAHSELERPETREGGDRGRSERTAGAGNWQPPAREQIIPRLVTALQDDDQRVRQAAVEALLGLGLTAWPDLLLVLMDTQSAGDQRLRRSAMGVLQRSSIATAITAPLLSKLQGPRSATYSIMLEADRLYRRLLSNQTFAARVTNLRTREPAALRLAQPHELLDIPLEVAVQCRDELGGHARMVIVDPTQRQLTYLVVQEVANRYVRRMVPLELVRESTPAFIRLRCTRRELAQHQALANADRLEPIRRYVYSRLGDYRLGPHAATPPSGWVAPEPVRIPPGELSITRRTLVKAKDGRVGEVAQLLVHRQTKHITHLLLRAGPLWSQNAVTIPVGQIDYISDEAIFLNVDKAGVAALAGGSVKPRLF